MPDVGNCQEETRDSFRTYQALFLRERYVLALPDTVQSSSGGRSSREWFLGDFQP